MTLPVIISQAHAATIALRAVKAGFIANLPFDKQIELMREAVRTADLVKASPINVVKARHNV